jgi:hypothetical protein
MSNTIRNQEIVNKFLASKSFDFAAFGKFVAENGASIANSEDGEFGFVVGHRFIRYCIPPVTHVLEGVDPVAARGAVAGGEVAGG